MISEPLKETKLRHLGTLSIIKAISKTKGEFSAYYNFYPPVDNSTAYRDLLETNTN